MSTSSIVIESKGIAEHKHAKDYRVVVPTRLQLKDKKFEAIRMRINRYVIEDIKSSVVVVACLALYMITGVHTWWIQFVQKILSNQ